MEKQLVYRKNGQLIYRCTECLQQLYTPESQLKSKCHACNNMMEFETILLKKGSKIYVRKV